jgi:outer membrane receptor protein involved in Fe transport
MDGDAIGGAVDLITKRVPNVCLFNGTLGAGYNDIADDGISQYNLAWGDRAGTEERFGYLISGNYLETDRGSDNPDSEASFPERPDAAFPGQAEWVGNLALSYEKAGFSGRLSANHHDDYLFEVGGEPEVDTFVDAHTQLDFAASQSLTRRLRLHLEVINLTDSRTVSTRASPIARSRRSTTRGGARSASR